MAACQIAASLANSYRETGNLAKVLWWTDQQTQADRDRYADDRLRLAKVLADGGARLLKVNALAEAEALLRECLAIQQAGVSKSWSVANTQSLLGEALCRRRKFVEAETLLTEAYDELQRQTQRNAAGERAQWTTALTSSIERLRMLYEATGHAEA